MKYSVVLRRLAGWLNVNMDPSLILFFQKKKKKILDEGRLEIKEMKLYKITPSPLES